jgi:hypothetical protein
MSPANKRPIKMVTERGKVRPITLREVIEILYSAPDPKPSKTRRKNASK